MEQYLIKLNQPVIVDSSTCKEKKQTTIYGFLTPAIEEDKEPADYLIYDINSYVDYLAAMDERNNIDDRKFDKERDKNLICWSQRISDMGKKRRKKTGLTFTISKINLDEIDGDCLNCGMDQSIITCDSLMDNLTRLAEQQEEEQKKTQHSIALFNRPIWLPKNILWAGEEGFCHIYGLVIDKEFDSKLIEDCKLYLGYLAMIEELTLNDITPSGFTADLEKDGWIWYDRGVEYTLLSDELKKECLICLHKHNLLPICRTVYVSGKDLKQGVRDGYILSKKLYEHLRTISANVEDNCGCQNLPF